MTVAEQWRELVSVAMLGTDRRNPPEPEGLIADLVDDTVRSTPSERMLAQVAATVAVRRAGVLPGPARPPIAGPDADDRPVCVPAAAERWHHVVSSWPVLEDEWMLTLLTNGWRVPPDLVPELLTRHRSDPIRRTRAELACGPLAGWLVGHLPELGCPWCSRHRDPNRRQDDIAELPALPIPPDLEPLLHADGAAVAAQLAGAIESGALVHAHRAVADQPGRSHAHRRTLADVAAALEAVDGASLGFRARVGPRRPRPHPRAHARRTANRVTTREFAERGSPGHRRENSLAIGNMVGYVRPRGERWMGPRPRRRST